MPAIASEPLGAPYGQPVAAEDEARGRRPRRRRWLPRWTLRLRLTLLYGALFMVAGTGLLAITYGLVANGTRESVAVSAVPTPPPGSLAQARVLPGVSSVSPEGGGAVVLQAYRGQVTALFQRLSSAQAKQFSAANRTSLIHQRTVQLNTLLTRSGIALAVMALLSIGLGWLTAGRALRPVRTMSARARGISERNLHERLALDGPDDELKELADTFDGLLGRLETAFESQRRFVANASHELRTPITLERTLVEVALADPNPSVDSLRETCKRVVAAGEQQERLIEALLTLARSQRGLAVREQVDLGVVAGDVVQALSSNGIRIESELGAADVAGDPALIERLVANLLDNAVDYNRADGWVSVRTTTEGGRPKLTIMNSGPLVEADQVATLTEPFRRLDGERMHNAHKGLGLGLSIVGAIAAAHDADLQLTPRPSGGLAIEVSFPTA